MLIALKLNSIRRLIACLVLVALLILCLGVAAVLAEMTISIREVISSAFSKLGAFISIRLSKAVGQVGPLIIIGPVLLVAGASLLFCSCEICSRCEFTIWNV